VNAIKTVIFLLSSDLLNVLIVQIVNNGGKKIMSFVTKPLYFFVLLFSNTTCHFDAIFFCLSRSYIISQQ